MNLIHLKVAASLAMDKNFSEGCFVCNRNEILYKGCVVAGFDPEQGYYFVTDFSKPSVKGIVNAVLQEARLEIKANYRNRKSVLFYYGEEYFPKEQVLSAKKLQEITHVKPWNGRKLTLREFENGKPIYSWIKKD